MTPDFEYFIRMKLAGEHGHTWPGIIYFDLPVGFILLIAWYYLVREPFIHNLPKGVAERLKHLRIEQWRPWLKSKWPVILFSLMIGAASHVLWDSFTHNNTFITGNIPFLRTGVYFFNEGYPLYHILQHVSTGVGLAIGLTIFFVQPAKPFVRKRSPAFWPVLIGLTGALAAFRLAFMDFEIKIGHVVVILIAAGMYACLLTSAIFLRRYR